MARCLKCLERMRRAVERLTLACAGAMVLTIAAPAYAQQLPAQLDQEMITQSMWTDGSTFRFAEIDLEAAAQLRVLLKQGRSTVADFFGSPFPKGFNVAIVPDRESFSAVLRNEWDVPQTECWMVGTAAAEFLVILSPRSWAAEACEHPNKRQHILDIVTHELTHVYHCQNNPTRDFEGAEEIGWFVEGLAVLVADQLNRSRLSDPAQAVAAGKAPKRLADAWTGQYRYGISGSLVGYIDEKYGRSTVRELLAAVTQEELLGILNVTERQLLDSWEAWVRARE